MEKISIYEAIPAAIKHIAAVGKDHTNEKQGWKFRSIDDVYNAVNKAIKEIGITICPTYEIITDKTEEVTNQYGKKSMQNEVVLKAIYKLYSTDGSYIEVTTFGKKLDYGDKGFNAAMSGAYKYMMFQVFCIPTEEEAKQDPDTEAPTIDQPEKKKPTTKKDETPKSKVKPLTKEQREKTIDVIKKQDFTVQDGILNTYNVLGLIHLTDDNLKDIAHKKPEWFKKESK